MCKIKLLFPLIFSFLIGMDTLHAQYQTSGVKIEGSWDLHVEGNEENSVLVIEPQNGPIAMGTLDGSPLIINRHGDNINFVCDRKEKGKRIRVRFIGSIKNSKISGKMYYHPGRYEGVYVVWKASKLEEYTSERD